MDLLEHEAKAYLANYGLPILPSRLITSSEQAFQAANDLGGFVVLKAQVRTGGRAKAGGIRLVHSASEAARVAQDILDMQIKGLKVESVLVEHAQDLDSEFYLSFSIDRRKKSYLLIFSKRGGVDIEDLAKKHPELILQYNIAPLDKLANSVLDDISQNCNLGSNEVAVRDFLQTSYDCFKKLDAELLEINPIGLTVEGKIFAIDAKVTLDLNASFRHKEWTNQLSSSLDPRERQAKQKGLNYVGLSGSVGIIGNGAGLVMATLDLIEQAGGSPANFLDVGGGAEAELLANAIEVINSDPKVSCILINIFGGITRCDLVAKGIIAALERVALQCPIVVRLDGTNAKEGKELLANYSSKYLISCQDMIEAATKAVELAGDF